MAVEDLNSDLMLLERGVRYSPHLPRLQGTFSVGLKTGSSGSCRDGDLSLLHTVSIAQGPTAASCGPPPPALGFVPVSPES